VWASIYSNLTYISYNLYAYFGLLSSEFEIDCSSFNNSSLSISVSSTYCNALFYIPVISCSTNKI
jgi:hypothetical protein